MIAYSRIPPLRQECHQTAQLELPIESVITVDAINQSHQKKKTHVIANPNQLATSTIGAIQITNYQAQNKKALVKDENIATLNPIANVQVNHQVESEIPIQNKAQQKTEELTHILFISPQQRKTIILHKNSIFNKNQQNNQSYHDANAHQEVLESHIQCTLFGKSKQKPHQINPYRTEYTSNNKNQKISSTNVKQKSKSTFQKAQRETFDKDLYQQYHRNKNKPKHLGGRKSSTAKNQSKLNLKPVKLQITKITSINPIIF